MRKILSLAIVLALTLGLVGLSQSGSWADDEETLKVIEKFTAFHPVDNEPPGDSPGDFAVIRADLFKNKDGKAGKKIGTSVVTCFVMEVSEPRFIIQCNATYTLEDGTLSLQALINEHAPSPHTFDVAVLGGTGDFRKARGHGTAKEKSEEEILVTLKLS
jgi:allene oxide cyclase-like protein